jgi:uncharacterized protein (DUF2132 family)
MNSDPLHGVKLEQILIALEKELGWQKIGELLNIRCFINNPRLKSSLKFLRKTPWARSKVEILYLKTFCSKHKETGKLIRAILNQKQDNPTIKNDKSDGFNWPTIKR